MTSFPMRLAFLTFALSFAIAANGQAGDWYVAPSIIWNDDDGSRNTDDSVSGFQIEVGRDWTERLSFEGILGYSDIDGWVERIVTVPSEKHLDLGANLLVFRDRDASFAQFVLVGVGYLDNKIGDGSDFGWSFKPGANSGSATASVGLGFKWRMGQSRYSLRGQYRSRTAFDDETLTDRLVTIGVEYSFGSRRSDPGVPDTNIDTDGDGVLDMWDECENTPPGVEVTSRGCEQENIERDEDGDHVYDSVDECPGTPMGAPVDRRGCSLDSDMDGVTTDKDRCPGTRAGAEVNIYGCENDDDRDGVPNHRDDCPDSKSGARVDVSGCEIRDIISLPGVNFETGFDILLPGTEYILKDAADILNRYPDMQIEVAGHTDDVGDASSNQGLSERRAKTVLHFLIRYGISEDRLTYTGYGESRPIADNTTPEGRATNRRVELRLVDR